MEELIAQVRRAAGNRRVLEVFARCPAAVAGAEIAECFSYVVEELASFERASEAPGERASSNGPWLGGACELTGAELTLEIVPVRLRCICGFEGELGEDDMAGHIGICPGCGRPQELDASLELVGISYAGGDV